MIYVAYVAYHIAIRGFANAYSYTQEIILKFLYEISLSLSPVEFHESASSAVPCDGNAGNIYEICYTHSRNERNERARSISRVQKVLARAQILEIRCFIAINLSATLFLPIKFNIVAT